MFNLLWQFDSKDLNQEMTAAVSAFEQRTGRPATLVLVRQGVKAVPPAGVELKEVSFVTPGTCQVAGEGNGNDQPSPR